MSKQTNPYYELVDNLVSGKITLLVVQMAIKEFVRRSEEIPEGVKNLVAPYSDTGNGVIDKCFELMKQVIGETELAYRRGYQGGLESKGD